MRTAHLTAVLGLALAAAPAFAQNVKITPVGSHPGELCANDRATIFEDPTGVRLLYDAGQTVTGADDPRLGDIHVVLLSHAHGDHIGDQKLKAPGAGACANSERVPAGPNSTTAEIAAAKNAAIAMTSDMGTFIGRKVQNIRGKPVEVCPLTAGATTVPVAAPCRSNTHLGGAFTVRGANAARGVEITIVFASHANNVPLSLLSEAQRATLGPDGMSLVLGPPTGYVLKFTNGLTAYLSGDTGIHTEMRTVVSEYHKANLAVLNLGPSAGTVMSGAYAMNELVRPASVILTHPNEAVTEGGKLRPASRTAALVKELKPAPHLAISGRTMEFDGNGRCVAGC
ncbi:MAG TPA: MBL fold metallo-hydrolase [Burkholderiales bacterium]|jgi:L-ascorbate metabolism protein UlaG (beta-lactamase superfamily)|nr:MBL fold metallo-hydrolase [Burkholderiales bacterium]